MARVVLAMSGGVDSSVAAHLLLEAGHEVIGLFMRHGEPVAATACNATATKSSTSPPAPPLLPVVTSTAPAHKQGCCSASDAEDARRVAERLDIPFYAVDFQDEFGEIIDYFVSEYLRARTPNPCVVCNTWLKFGKLFEYADGVGAEFVATGHYARLEMRPGEQAPALCRGVDRQKDQAYVLFGVERSLLTRMMLPVGDYRKDEIRRMAEAIGLRVADKRDSQEICFVPSGDHGDFIRRRQGPSATAGEIVTTSGEVVGHHDGIERFTIGQRKGLGVALGEPRFVVRIEPDERRVVIGTREDLARRELVASRCNWLVDLPVQPMRCEVKIRYQSSPAAAAVEPLGDDRISIIFDEPQYGVAPGQAAVCFRGEQVLGGGWID